MRDIQLFNLEAGHRAYLDELKQQARIQDLVREAQQGRERRKIVFNQRRTFALAFATVIAAMFGLMVASSVGLLTVA